MFIKKRRTTRLGNYALRNLSPNKEFLVSIQRLISARIVGVVAEK
jgi:hypothetical protein